MTSAPDRTQAITDAVQRYIELVGSGNAEQLAALYAEDATLADPVGGEVHIGRQAIRGFYTAIENLERAAELVTIRVAGNEAAFAFSLVITAGDRRMRIEPIDVMVFDGDGRIAGMKAYWSAANITQL